jgi:hypothetical protein
VERRRVAADSTVPVTETRSPAETERLRQEMGDVTTDARDTLVSRPPTDERR